MNKGLSNLAPYSGRNLCVHHGERGFSLIELMVAMVLGLIVIAGAGSVFLASSRTYRTNQALSDVQTNSRVAFELLARDIRNAGQTACNNNGRVANVLNNKDTSWYANWSNVLHGYGGAQNDPAVVTGVEAKQRVANTDSVQLVGAKGTGLSVKSHNAETAKLTLNNPTEDVKKGDIIIVCSPDHSAILQVTNYNSQNVALIHNSGAGDPGNCSKGLGYPTLCSGNGNSYAFTKNAAITKLAATDWYIGNNPVGTHSLYRIELVTQDGKSKTQAQEMVRNVDNMIITYHQSPNAGFVSASAVGDWAAVDAIRIDLKLKSTDKRAGIDNQAIARTFTSTTAVRSRVK